MPGYELIGEEEKNNLFKIFSESNGVLFAHGFDGLRNGKFKVREFEKEFSKKLGCNYSQAITSGTVAQLVAMLAMGIKRGDEVITQSHTFVATVESILAIGAKPVIVDIDDTYNMDISDLENAITEKTKLIVPVHMLGNPCKMDEIMNISKKYNIPVLEDACEALGGSYKNQSLGTIGNAGIFSLDFAKTITTGEGGMIITNNKDIYQYSKEYHDHGHQSNPNFPRGRDTRVIPGMNYRITEMQGAVGLAQLEKLDYIVNKNRHNQNLLKKNISSSKIKFRTITDLKGDLADTLIFNFEKKSYASKFVKKYNSKGYYTKNIPDALDWHFSGTWNQMFKDVKEYKDCWNTKWKKSADLLYRSIAIPILVNSDETFLLKQAETINGILSEI